jgi:hypothetical protein
LYLASCQVVATTSLQRAEHPYGIHRSEVLVGASHVLVRCVEGKRAFLFWFQVCVFFFGRDSNRFIKAYLPGPLVGSSRGASQHCFRRSVVVATRLRAYALEVTLGIGPSLQSCHFHAKPQKLPISPAGFSDIASHLLRLLAFKFPHFLLKQILGTERSLLRARTTA